MLAVVAAMFAALLLSSPAAHATTATPSPSDSASEGASDGPTDGAEFADRISGVVRNEGAPLEGVRITASGNGYEGETETGANGSWSIGVPEQGAYEVELEESSLPDGVALAEGPPAS